jgi:hypothetical protein
MERNHIFLDLFSHSASEKPEGRRSVSSMILGKKDRLISTRSVVDLTTVTEPLAIEGIG